MKKHQVITITKDLFWKTFRPVTNPYQSGEKVKGCLFGISGKELHFVEKLDPAYVWTVILNRDDNSLWAASGFRVTDRVHYLVTSEPVPEDTVYCFLLSEGAIE